MVNNENKLKINLLLQTLYQVLDTCLPLITAPYLARVLGANNLGIFSYTNSVVTYFAIFAMLGTVNYGTRCIASTDNKHNRSKTFWEIYLLQAFFCIISIIAYIFYIVYGCKENRIIAIIQTLTLVSCLTNINWLFFGLEMFKITVTRNTFIRIGTVICILTFVNDANDLPLYTGIMLGGSLISELILFWFAKDKVYWVKPSIRDIIRHLKPNIVLFIPLLAMSVYHTMDKTMLGLLSDYNQSGYYYNADKVVNIPVSIITGISTVMLPRISNMIAQGKDNEAKQLFCISLEGTILVASAIAFGIAAIAKEFIPLFFGSGFDDCIILTILLSPVLVIKAFSFTVRNQFLIPYRMERDFTFSVILGAVVNLIINLLFIPRYGGLGAVIGTVIAELVACFWQCWSIKKRISFRRTILHSFAYIIIGTLMLFAVRAIALLPFGSVVVSLVIEVLIGATTFISLVLLYWKFTKNNMPRIMFSGMPILDKLISKFL